jgi:membrane fusion protein, heavy metal efflux system
MAHLRVKRPKTTYAIGSCLWLLAIWIAPLGCNKSTNQVKPVAAAKVEMTPHESELATITLTIEAEARLGITTVAAKKDRVQQHRTFGGEVVVPSGRSISIAAPVNGVVKPASNQSMPLPGARVKASEIVLLLTPILSPERDVPTPVEQVQMAGVKATLVSAQVIAQGDVQRGKADVAAASITLERARKLLQDRAGSQRAFDDAQALYNVATSVLSASEERSQQLTKLIGTLEGKRDSHELATDITVRAPVEGLIRNIGVSAGQQVVVGATLFEVLDTSQVWIRVPIFVDLLSSIQSKTIGRVVALDGKPIHRTQSTQSTQSMVSPISSPIYPASPIDAPPTADSASSSADLYYEVSNLGLHLRPGQRVGVDLAMDQELDATLVPAASILYDIHGGTWVYTTKEPHRIVRQRVAVQWFDGEQAILQRGPAEGTMVVADGAAELFGTEFGTGK